MEKENWIIEVFESTKGMHKAEPSPFLFEKITARITKGDLTSVSVSPFLKWGLASLVIVMFSLNVISILNTNKEVVAQEATIDTATDSYFNTSTTYTY